MDGFQEIRFRPVTTCSLRAVLNAAGTKDRHAGLAVEEWEALAPSVQISFRKSGTGRAAAVQAE